MFLRQLKKVIRPLVNSGVSLHLRSAPGVGKSEFTDQIIREFSSEDGFEWGVSKMFVATLTPNDLMGFMVPRVRDGRDVAVWTEPTWLTEYNGTRPLSSFKRSLLILEEFGQGEGDVKRASADLFLNRRVGPHRLPDGCSIIALSNRAQDRSGVGKDFDFRINRETSIDIQPELQSWEEWAWESNVDPLFITFANQNPEIVFNSEIPEKQGPWCTPRSLMMLEKHWRHLGGSQGMPVFTDTEGRSNPEFMEIAAGTIGAGAASQFISMVMLGQEMPKFEDILKHPDKVRVPTRADAQMLVVYSLAHRANEDNLGPLISYIERMPEEFTVTFGRAACRRDVELVNTKAFGDWTRRNASLMMAITDAR